jgi:hypothetical protein
MAKSTEKQTAAKRATDLSDEVLERVEARQRAAMEALRNFVNRLGDAMPNLVDDPSGRKKVIDAIVDYYEQVAMTTNEFVARMARSAIATLNERATKTTAKRATKTTAKRATKTTAKRATNTAAKRAANTAAKRATKRARY